MITLHRARLETRNFEFEAFGYSKDQAKAALVAGLAKHAKQHRLPWDWFKLEDVQFSEIGTGLAYRDREPLLTKDEMVTVS
jgi:hypothetical protein